MANSDELQKQVEQYEQDKKNGVKKKKKGTWKYILNISFVLIVTIVSIVISLWGHTRAIWDNFSKADPLWILAIIGIMVASDSHKAEAGSFDS